MEIFKKYCFVLIKIKLLLVLILLVNVKLFCYHFFIGTQHFDNIVSSFSINQSKQIQVEFVRNNLSDENIYKDSLYKFVCNQNEFEIEGDFDSISIDQHIDSVYECIEGILYSLPNSFSTLTSINLCKIKNGYKNLVHIFCEDFYSMDLDSFYKINDSLVVRKQHAIF